MRSDLTQERLQFLLSYDPETGEFKFLVSRGGRMSGSVAGYIQRDGYSKIRIDNYGHVAHRLAWLYVTGAFPTGELDHINGVRSDNRFSNLRDVSHTENQRNCGLASNNTSGYRGVCFHKQMQRWMARVHVNDKKIYLGLFDTPEDAHAAYAIAAAELGFSDRHIYGDNGEARP